jgi:glycosyltransferase involved in cell wall biosynthesis
LLVIDDGSSDGWADVFSEDLEILPDSVGSHRQQKQGQCATLNEGLSQTSGEYFACLG